jgi:hypothetical protein
MIGAMPERIGGGDAVRVGFEAFGVHVCVEAPAGPLADGLTGALPPQRSESDPQGAAVSFALVGRAGEASVVKQGEPFTQAIPLDAALEVLEREIRIEIALRAPEVIFVHAGVVAAGDRALVLPGASFSGKTTLVAALADAGATYFSDEYAVLDADGNVHPYARPLGIRVNGVHQRHDAAERGWDVGEHPVPVKAVVVASYSDGATWNPQPLSKGAAVLALLANTVPAQTRPAESLNAATRAVEDAVLQQGQRGDASRIAPLLLDALRRA